MLTGYFRRAVVTGRCVAPAIRIPGWLVQQERGEILHGPDATSSSVALATADTGSTRAVVVHTWSERVRAGPILNRPAADRDPKTYRHRSTLALVGANEFTLPRRRAARHRPINWTTLRPSVTITGPGEGTRKAPPAPAIVRASRHETAPRPAGTTRPATGMTPSSALTRKRSIVYPVTEDTTDGQPSTASPSPP